MEYWENSYSSWNWYNEVLEHRDGGSIFEADEEQNKEAPQEDNKDGGEQRVETTKEGDKDGGNQKTEEKKEGDNAENVPGENVENEENDKNTENNGTDPLEEQFLDKPTDDIQLQGEAGEYLIELHNSYSDVKVSGYNPWKLDWGTHPKNIAAQLKWLFPEPDGSWKIWEPKYKGTRDYSAKSTRGLGERWHGGEVSDDNFKIVSDISRDEWCSSRIQLNNNDKPISKVFDLVNNELAELANKTGFINDVNIDILALMASNKDDREELLKKMKKQLGVDNIGGLGKDIINNDVYLKPLFRPLTVKELIEIKEKFDNETSNEPPSNDKEIKKKKQIGKAIENISKNSTTESYDASGLKNGKKKQGIEKDTSCILLKPGDTKNAIENILSEADGAPFSINMTRDDMMSLPTNMVNSLYSLSRLIVEYRGSGDDEECLVSAVYDKKPGLNFKYVKSYERGVNDIKEDSNNRVPLIVSSKKMIDSSSINGTGEWEKDSNYGIEISRDLYGFIFSPEQQELTHVITGILSSVNTPSTDYLSPLAGLNLSGIRRELMESSSFEGLLEATLDNYNLDKGLPKFDKKKGKLTYLTKTDFKNRVGSVTYKGIRQEEKNGAARTMWLVQSKSDPSKTYTVQIDIEVPGKGGLFAIAKKYGKKKKKGEIRNINADRKLLRTSNLSMYCNCPDFHYSGAEHNLNKKNELILNPDTGGVDPGKRFAYTTKDGKSYVDTYPTTVAPSKRDPNGVKDRCKHIHAALLEFRKKIPTIFMDARKIENVDLEKVSSFREDVDTAAQSPDIQMDKQGALNDLANMIQPDTTEQNQTEPIETAESNEEETRSEQTEEQNEETSMVAEENPEEYPAEPEGEYEQTGEPEQEEQPAEPEQEEEPDHFADAGNMMDEDETVDKLEEEKNKRRSLPDRIKDGLKDFGSKIKNVARRFFRHEDCELAGQLIERVLESDDPRVIQESVSQIANLLEANGKHDYAKTLLEGVYERPGRRTK